MRKLLLAPFIFAVLFSFDCFAKKDNVDEYNLTQNEYTFSTVFEMYSDQELMGSVVKSVFHVRTHYDLYDGQGNFIAQGIKTFFNLGVFYTWATEIEIYNGKGDYIGYIDGQVATSEEAKFSLYNQKDERIGIAYLEKNCAAFSIVDPNNSQKLLARLSRNFVVDQIDQWEVAVFNQSLPKEIVQIFGAFACDTQEYFKVDK